MYKRQPFGPEEPVDPVGPDPPIGPVPPVDPVGPEPPVDPVGPDPPIGPVPPVDPVGPEPPVDPVGPDAPVEPVGPDEPVEPVGPDEPVEPAGAIGAGEPGIKTIGGMKNTPPGGVPPPLGIAMSVLGGGSIANIMGKSMAWNGAGSCGTSSAVGPGSLGELGPAGFWATRLPQRVRAWCLPSLTSISPLCLSLIHI